MPLWDFELDYGRMGVLHGTFEATEEEIEEAIGKTVWWDEELGKHSNDEFVLEKSMITPHVEKPFGFDPLNNIVEEDEE